MVEGPETRFRILCVSEEDARGLPDEVRSTVRVHEVRLQGQVITAIRIVLYRVTIHVPNLPPIDINTKVLFYCEAHTLKFNLSVDVKGRLGTT